MTSSLFLAFLIAGMSRSVTLPAGVQLQVRLQTEVSSDKPSGQTISAVVIAPLFIHGELALSAGVEITGKTADARVAAPTANGGGEQPAQLRLVFTKVHEGSHSKSVTCVVDSVDNARETVDRTGLIEGVKESQTIEARIDQGISKLATRNQQFAQFLSSIEAAFVKKVDPSIDYKPGTELSLKLTAPLDWERTGAGMRVGQVEPASQLLDLVNAEPFRTFAERPPKLSDLTNLMFLGTREQIEEAFRSAGWFTARRLALDSKLETVRALIENRGYREAPVSQLYLDGQPPDLTLQKQNNTFAMRHHIRIWLRPEKFHGHPVWVAAATHDISIMFSPESRNFTHGIDPEIDKERAKVVNDLIFTKTVRAVALVDRAGIPGDATNATGDRLLTDGRLAVLQF